MQIKRTPDHIFKEHLTDAEQRNLRQIQRASQALRRAQKRQEMLELETKAALGDYVMRWAIENPDFARSMLDRLSISPPPAEDQPLFLKISRQMASLAQAED